jgi:hypothetical protein
LGSRKGPNERCRQETIFQLVLFKPTHYDDDGYPITWPRSQIPSNSLAALYGLGHDCQRRQVRGPDVEIVIKSLDETNTRVRPDRIIADFRRDGGKGLICLVGVQSNQFPRAVDIARHFLEARDLPSQEPPSRSGEGKP